LIVGRFLALLELYRDAMVVFEQITPLGDLTVRWTGSEDGEVEVTDEFDVDRDVDIPSVGVKAMEVQATTVQIASVAAAASIHDEASPIQAERDDERGVTGE